ncbi:MAG TPA: hypothetical protein VNN73_18780 [Blastocatellia bacterium]|jgi:hypothetical protein|nr:hypothetical protein [Blastocatellia bacterium]
MQEQEFLFNQMVNPAIAGTTAGDPDERPRRRRAPRKDSKKSRILELHQSGTTDIGEIARTVGTRPSYVASVLQSAGLLQGYFDLYTTTARDQNLYSRHFRNVLSFKTVEAAKESIAQIARLYNWFERIGDRAGQHHAEVLALTGRNRARWSGKKEEAKIFEQWLFNH